ncbi:hypothetical protein DFJ73DRAFT_864489 [Zopfochytrium polystomum]|nr:hypothetical protein DFJ73DRAFT_864489 [Zopfochytrium polystomum]
MPNPSTALPPKKKSKAQEIASAVAIAAIKAQRAKMAAAEAKKPTASGGTSSGSSKSSVQATHSQSSVSQPQSSTSSKMESGKSKKPNVTAKSTKRVQTHHPALDPDETVQSQPHIPDCTRPSKPTLSSGAAPLTPATPTSQSRIAAQSTRLENETTLTSTPSSQTSAYSSQNCGLAADRSDQHYSMSLSDSPVSLPTPTTSLSTSLKIASAALGDTRLELLFKQRNGATFHSTNADLEKDLNDPMLIQEAQATIAALASNWVNSESSEDEESGSNGSYDEALALGSVMVPKPSADSGVGGASSFHHFAAESRNEKPIKLPRKRAHLSHIPLPLPPPPLLPVTGSLVGPVCLSNGNGLRFGSAPASALSGSSHPLNLSTVMNPPSTRSAGSGASARRRPTFSSRSATTLARPRWNTDESGGRQHYYHHSQHFYHRQTESNGRSAGAAVGSVAMVGGSACGGVGSDSDLSDDGLGSPIRDHYYQSPTGPIGVISNGFCVGSGSISTQSGRSGGSSVSSSQSSNGSINGMCAPINVKCGSGGSSTAGLGLGPSTKGLTGFPTIAPSISGYDGSQDAAAATAALALSLGVAPPTAPGVAIDVEHDASKKNSGQLSSLALLAVSSHHWAGYQGIRPGGGKYLYGTASPSGFTGIVPANGQIGVSSSGCLSQGAPATTASSGPLSTSKKKKRLLASPLMSADSFTDVRISDPCVNVPDAEKLSSNVPVLSSIQLNELDIKPPGLKLSAELGSPFSSKLPESSASTKPSISVNVLPSSNGSPLGSSKSGSLGSTVPANMLGLSSSGITAKFEFGGRWSAERWPSYPGLGPKLLHDHSQTDCDGSGDLSEEDEGINDYCEVPWNLYDMPKLMNEFELEHVLAAERSTSVSTNIQVQPPILQHHQLQLDQSQPWRASEPPQGEFQPGGYNVNPHSRRDPVAPTPLRPQNPQPLDQLNPLETKKKKKKGKKSGEIVNRGSKPSEIFDLDWPISQTLRSVDNEDAGPGEAESIQHSHSNQRNNLPLSARSGAKLQGPSPNPPSVQAPPGSNQQQTQLQSIPTNQAQATDVHIGASNQIPQTHAQQQSIKQQQRVQAPPPPPTLPTTAETVNAESESVLDGFTKSAVPYRYRRARFNSAVEREHSLKMSASLNAAMAVSSGPSSSGRTSVPLVTAAPPSGVTVGGFGGVSLSDEFVCFFCEFEHLFSRRAIRRRRRLLALAGSASLPAGEAAQ